MRKLRVFRICIAVLSICLLISGCNVGSVGEMVDKVTRKNNIESVLVFKAKCDFGETITEEDLLNAEDVMRSRLEDIDNYATVLIESNGRIIVELSEELSEEQIEFLGRTAVLEFRDADGNVILNGDDVKAARTQYGQTKAIGDAEYHVVLEFTGEGRRKFADATGAAISKAEDKRFISAYLDETVILSASVEERIDSESCIVTFGNGTTAEAAEESREIVKLINAGRLPFEVEVESYSILE